MKRPFKKIQEALHEDERGTPSVGDTEYNAPQTDRLIPKAYSGEESSDPSDKAGVSEGQLERFKDLLDQGMGVREIAEKMDIRKSEAIDMLNALNRSYPEFESNYRDVLNSFKDFLAENGHDMSDNAETLSEEANRLFDNDIEKELFDTLKDRDDNDVRDLKDIKAQEGKTERTSDIFGNFLDMSFSSLSGANPEQTPENYIKVLAAAIQSQVAGYTPTEVGIQGWNTESLTINEEEGEATIEGTDDLGRDVTLYVNTDHDPAYFRFEIPSAGNLVKMRFAGSAPLNNLHVMLQHIGTAIIQRDYQPQDAID